MYSSHYSHRNITFLLTLKKISLWWNLIVGKVNTVTGDIITILITDKLHNLYKGKQMTK